MEKEINTSSLKVWIWYDKGIF